MKKGTRVSFCGGRYWCPGVHYDGERVVIEDDHGKKARLSKEHWNRLVKEIRSGTLDEIK